jgi:ABC-type bacteriocin/lantibiotic exporter with double-glycine peptidase domain
MLSNYRKLTNLLNKKLKRQLNFFIPLSFVSGFLEVFSMALLIPLLNKSFLIEDESNNFINKIFDKFFFKTIELETIFLLIFFLLFLKNILLLIVLKKKYELNFNIIKFLSSALFLNYLNYIYAKISNINSSRIINNITTECMMVGRCAFSWVSVINESLYVFLIVIFLFYFNLKISVILLFLFLVFFIIFYYIHHFFFRKLSNVRIEIEAERLKNIQETFQGIFLVKIFNLKNLFFTNFKKTDKMFEIYTKERILSESPRILIELYFIILIGISFVFINNKKLLPDNFVAISLFTLAFVRVIPSVNRILAALSTIKYCENSLKVIFQEKKRSINKDFSFKKNKNIKSVSDFNKRILLKNIYFKFSNQEDYLFKKFNFEIKKNTIIGITGKSGSGKTTILNILTGLYNIKNHGIGHMSIDGKIIDPNKINLSKLYSYTPQNTFIFNNTIKNNLLIFREQEENSVNKENPIKDEDLKNFIKISELSSFINNQKYGINTMIKEGGSNLSGGQKQRIGICRSLISNRPIIIFDESTNSIDKSMQEKILKNLKKLKKNKTLIFISHDKNVLNICDKVINLD